MVLLLRPVSAGPLTDAMPHVKGTRAIVLEQLELLLAADKDLQLVGQGSWLKTAAELASKNGAPSRAYRDPLLIAAGESDHDLRLVMKGREEAALGSKFAALSQAEQAAIRARDEAALAAKWLNVRENLIKNLRAAIPVTSDAKVLEQKLLQYGFSASEAATIAKTGSKNVIETILGSVNLYAPPSLIRTVVDDRTARTVYRGIGGVPNLGGKEVEGVWGVGAPAATQEFEAGGKLFYNGIGGARTGFVDLVHLSEEYGRYSFGGAANMSAQWAEKAAEAIRTGDMSLVAKYLKRLKATWALAIKKGGLRSTSMSTSLSELNAFIAAAETGELAVLSGGRTMEQFLRTARMQSAVLGQLARDSASVDREIMLAILEAQPLSRWDKAGQWFREVWPSAESLAVFERAMQGAFLVFSTWQVSGTWGEKGMEDALRQAGVEGAMLVSLPVGALMSLTNSLLDNAKEFGYNSAVQPQEWREFLDGISSVVGYEGFTKKELSIGGLAVQCVSLDEVRQSVEKQAVAISQLKDTGAAETDETRKSRIVIRDKLIARMTPIVSAEWLRERKRLITGYLDLALELDERMNTFAPFVSSASDPIRIEKDGPTTASVSLVTKDDVAALQAQLAKMEAAIRPLGGPQHIVVFSYRGSVSWELNGRKREVSTTTNLKELFNAVSLSLPGAGDYLGTVQFHLEVRAPSLGLMDEARDVYDAQPIIGRTYERKIPFRVNVVLGGVKVFREWWDKEQKIVKREYEYVDQPGALPGYEKQRVGFERIYFENGKLQYEARRKENQLDGPMTRYWDTGAVADTVTYKMGARQGAFLAFDVHGKPVVEGQFLNDRKTGHWKYYDNGVRWIEGDYAADGKQESIPMRLINAPEANSGYEWELGAKTGTWTLYWKSGKKREETDHSPAAAFTRTYYDNAGNSRESECTKSGCRYWDSNGKEIIK
ncbi:MAG: hypothetical protein WCQ64_02625 [Acidobacteriota bacterium]